MPKILFLVDTYPDKHNYANIFVQNQAIGLKSAGLDIAILIIDIRSIRKLRRFGFYKEEAFDLPTWRISVPWGPFFLGIGQKLANYLGCLAYKKIQEIIGKPDILHAHFGNVGIIGSKIKEKYNIPLLITEHGSLMLPGNSSSCRKQRIINEGYRNSDYIVAVGNNLQDHIKAAGIDNVKVIPNIIPDFFFEFQEHVIKKSGKQFISIGNLLPSKRFDLTISAFARVCQIFDDTTLTIIGTGPQLKSLHKLTLEKKIQDKVKFCGFIPNSSLPKLYKESVCFVLPSDFETFGVVYAEAIACGIPAIATRCGGPEDIVNSTNGIIIPLNDEDALFDAMIFMYNNSKKYNPLFLSKDIYNRFGEESVIHRIIDLYLEIQNKFR